MKVRFSLVLQLWLSPGAVLGVICVVGDLPVKVRFSLLLPPWLSPGAVI